jgi:tetratricopeptide (TPR) repeat protein/AraC-like DNA-binding protein
MDESLSTDQIFIRKLTGIIVENLNDENFGVKELVRASAMSRSRLNRKLNAITDKTINQFIREVRLQKALEMLQDESVTVSEVAFKVGFSSPNYFNTCFHEYFGYPPGKVKKRSPESKDENLITYLTSIQEPKRSVWKAPTFYKKWIMVISGLIILVVILSYPRIFQRSILDDLRSSKKRIVVTVMPFQNLTNDTLWNVWQTGIQNILITQLSDFPKELEVRQNESINSLIQSKGLTSYLNMNPSIASAISKKLDANVFVYGSINKAGSSLLINAQLIDTKTKEIIKSFELDTLSGEANILPIINSLKMMLTNYLVISKLKIGSLPEDRFLETKSPEAYRYYVYGDNATMKGDFSTALTLLSKAIDIDSTFNEAMVTLILQYLNLALYDNAKKMCTKLYHRREQMPLEQKYTTDWIHAVVFETPWVAINCLRQSLEIDNQWPGPYYLIGFHYNSLLQFDKAIPEFEKALYLYKKWDTKPGYGNYTSLGYAYHKTGQYRKEKKLYRKAEKDYPDNGTVLFRQTILALSEGDNIAANRYIEKFKSVRKEQSWSEVRITTNLAIIYYQAGLLDKAEDYYRQALLIDPENPESLNNLAAFCIVNDRNVKEALELVEKTLKSQPENYNYLDTKGWGLYKQGKYQEAKIMLQKSWDLRLKYAVYNHDAFLHLEAVKKAVAGQKN